MTGFLIGFAVGGFLGAAAVIVWALCAAAGQQDEREGENPKNDKSGIY